MTTAIVPAYNEAERIGATVGALRSVPEVDEIVVVDDGSTDGTAEAADAAGATVLRLPSNRGKGGALEQGVKCAAGDVLVLLDADLGDTAAEAGALIRPVLDGAADMTIARFPVIPGRGGGVGLAVGMARKGVQRLTGKSIFAPLSGQRALRREVLQRVGGFERGFGAEVALTVDALRAGFRVLEVPVTMTHRVTGRDWPAVRHRARQFLAIARALWMRRRP